VTLPVFLLPDGALHGVEPGHGLALAGDEGHHAADVRRLRPGEQTDVADGSGRVARCRIAAVAGRRLELTVLEVRRAAPRTPRLVLVQALAKGGRDELAVQAATELGVDEIIPWQAERCVARWSADRGERGLRRWRGTAREATKQSRRPTLPAVTEPLDTPRLARERLPTAALALLLHEDADRCLSQALADPVAGLRDPAGPRGDLLVVVGPEGGIGQAELSRLTEAGGFAVRLGPEILRTSTAGPAALAVLSVFLGRW
jgi:16S rRNA (uracil1498-N3)-methyltransferase